MAEAKIEISTAKAIKATKEFWRRARAVLWTIALTLGALAVLTPEFEPIPFLRGLRYWIIALALVVWFWPMMARRFKLPGY